MATTTNYGWTTPDDTALVKDGASAIRTLGSSVDTTTKALNPETTLGDIAYRSSTANVKTRLGIGTTGQILTVAGGVPSWATASSGGMDLISTTTLSGTTTTISSIPQTYKNLQVVIRNPDSNNDPVYMKLRMNGNGSSTNHRNNLTYGSNADVSNDDTSIDVAFNFNTTTTEGISVVDIYDYTNTTTFTIGRSLSFSNNATTATNYSVRAFHWAFAPLDAITSLEFRANVGSFTAGTVLLYGVK